MTKQAAKTVSIHTVLALCVAFITLLSYLFGDSRGVARGEENQKKVLDTVAELRKTVTGKIDYSRGLINENSKDICDIKEALAEVKLMRKSINRIETLLIERSFDK